MAGLIKSLNITDAILSGFTVYVIMFAIPVTAEADEGEEWSAAVERGKLP